MASYWVCATFTLISACISLGYSVVAVIGSRQEKGSAAEYAFARSLALAAVAAVALFGRRHDWLVAVAVAMIIVQGVDAVIGSRLGDRVKTFGPAGTSVANLALLIWFVTR